ncbi:MAG: FG-GAP-like repeat-containing protein [Blastocatellia bacterium]|nr:FG-GAP-like repeat-containing protein [Blastocatellia bacterium]
MLTLSLSCGAQREQRSTPPPDREEAYRANNLGVALLEQYKYKPAAEAFQRALRIDPKLAIVRLNLSIALFYDRDWVGAAREAKVAAELMPNAAQPHYILALVARAQNQPEQALAAFRRVLQRDPRDVATNVNIGQIYLQQGKHAEAISYLRTAYDAEPYHATAAYNLALALLRTGQREQGQRLMQQFEQIRAGGYGTTLGQNYLEQGRYAEAIVSTGAEPELVDRAVPNVTLTEATHRFLPQPETTALPGKSPAVAPLFGRQFQADEFNPAAKRQLIAEFNGSVTLLDYDRDGDLDVCDLSPTNLRLYRNDGSALVDVTASSGLATADSNAINIGAVAGDYDNDLKPDLFVLRYGGNALYRNEGGGRFADVTAAAEIPSYPYLALSAAFADVDHDGDLDLFIAGFVDLNKPAANKSRLIFPDDFAAAPNMLLRNLGNGRFADITTMANVAGSQQRAVAVVPTDYDNRRDIDLLVLNYGSAPALLANRRDYSFRDVARDVGLTTSDAFVCVAAGDTNKDNFTDFFFGRLESPGLFITSDGQGRFVTSVAPDSSAGASAAQFFDYDNDGLLDLIVCAHGRLRVLRNLGSEWMDVSDRAVDAKFAPIPQSPHPRGFASGDLDSDGDTDLMARWPGGTLRIARNEGGNRHPSLRIHLTGRVSNRSGVATKIEVRAGSLRQKLETYAAVPAPAPADVLLGLGRRQAADVVRLIWPAGIVQAETEIPSTAAGPALVSVTELDRKPSSCPYLYTWNGERFEFVTDFLGGGEMGYSIGPGRWNYPDPVEYVRIRYDQLKPRQGRYELRVTNELEEVLYLDQLHLIAVAHPATVQVYPNEGMTAVPRPFRLWIAKEARPPAAAMDQHGHDVLARVLHVDRQYPDDFRLLPIRGYAEEHTLTLDLGQLSFNRTLLLLTGWTDYAFSSDNVAAHQAGLSLKPPSLQVKDRDGQWQTVIADIGIPVGRPQTIVLDLTDKFLSSSRELRITTNMRIYWDQILVATSDDAISTRTIRLDPVAAELRWRGFSEPLTPDGKQPLLYDYDRVSPDSPWKTPTGWYTREGDVRELLRQTDDLFVISRPGDEIALSFDATKLPPLPDGWLYTFLLYADGFSKEMDINSASPDHVWPLPFHGMSAYPYAPPESYPMTKERRAILERYNTRLVTKPLPSLLAQRPP